MRWSVDLIVAIILWHNTYIKSAHCISYIYVTLFVHHTSVNLGKKAKVLRASFPMNVFTDKQPQRTAESCWLSKVFLCIPITKSVLQAQGVPVTLETHIRLDDWIHTSTQGPRLFFFFPRLLTAKVQRIP